MVKIFFIIISIFGMLLIAAGILIKNETKQYWSFVAGGILLLFYSIYLRDPVFIPLQIIITSANLYKLYKISAQGRSASGGK